MPSTCAVLFCYGTIALIPRAGNILGTWLTNRPTAIRIEDFLRDITLFPNVSGNLSPIWSLTFEVIFSIFVFAYSYTLRGKTHELVIAILASSVGSLTGLTLLEYLPMFAIGVTLWKISRYGSPVTGLNSRWRALLLVALLTLPIVIEHIPGSSLQRFLAVAIWLPVATLFIRELGLGEWKPSLLCQPPVQFLGKVSFSLYLVHEPILIGAMYLSQGSLWAVLGSIPLALACATLFYRFIESPLHSWVRSI